MNEIYLKARCLKYVNSFEKSDELYDLLKGFSYETQNLLMELFSSFRFDIEELKKALQHRFPDGKTLLEELTENEAINTRQVQTEPKQRELGDL